MDQRKRTNLLLGAVLVVYTLACFAFFDLAPLEDDKFWWVPKALKIVETGPKISIFGALPQVLLEGSEGGPPPQWDGGLPDYGHPPLFFHYLALFFFVFGFGPFALHLALLPLALSALIGTAKLTEHMAKGWGWVAALLLACTPFFFAQGLRADLDLLLLAIVPWALLALLRRTYGQFAFLGILASFTKEPGVLLAVPAVIAWLLDQGNKKPTELNRIFNPLSFLRLELPNLLAVVSPFLALMAWGGIHFLTTGWALASPERLPSNASELVTDLMAASSFLLFEQGRVFLLAGLLLGLPLIYRLGRWQPLAILLSFALTILVFFATVGFFGASAGRLRHATHLRYFLPALPALIASAVVCFAALRRFKSTLALAPPSILALPILCVAFSLGDMTAPPDLGPERNLNAAQVSLARRAFAPSLIEPLAQGQRIWVGNAEVPDFQFPGVWVVETPLKGLKRYGPGMSADRLKKGDWVIVSAQGEPPGFLIPRLARGTVKLESQLGAAWVKAIEITD